MRRRYSDADTVEEPAAKKRCTTVNKNGDHTEKDAEKIRASSSSPESQAKSTTVVPLHANDSSPATRSPEAEDENKDATAGAKATSSTSEESENHASAVSIPSRPPSATQTELQQRQKLATLQPRESQANSGATHVGLPKINSILPSAISQNKQYCSPYPSSDAAPPPPPSNNIGNKLASSTPKQRAAVYRSHANHHALDPPIQHELSHKPSDGLRPGFQLYARYHDVAAFIRTCSPHRTPDRSLVVLRFEAVPPY